MFHGSADASAKRDNNPEEAANHPTVPVLILVRDGVMPAELGMIWQAFRQAEDQDGRKVYDVKLAAIESEKRTVRADGDMIIGGLSQLPERLDDATCIIPASHSEDTSLSADEMQEKYTDLARLLRLSKRVGSVCTAAFLLCAFGVFNDAEATTHWKSAAQLAARYPLVKVNPNPLYIAGEKFWSSAGEIAGMDMALEMIRRDFGSSTANAVGRDLIFPPQRLGGQQQFYSWGESVEAVGIGARVADMVLSRLDEPFSLDSLANELHVSSRTLTRRFRLEMGVSIKAWMTSMRTKKALELLETSEQSIGNIAVKCGFADESALRRAVKAEVGVSPRQYRETFGRSYP